MAKAVSVDAELEAFEQAHGVRKRRGGCRVCVARHRLLYEAAYMRNWSAADIIALAESKGELLTQGNVNYHFQAARHHASEDT